jgi:tetratricopeptide (TPR) repeat protein
LSEPERYVFRRLAVFAGPFDLAAATAVGKGGQVDEVGAEDAFFSLVDKSLVLPGTAGLVSRYRLLESIRQFAEEQLAGAGEEERLCACDRLVAHYTAVVARAEPEFFGPHEDTWLERLAEDQPNLLVALGYADAGIGTADWGLGLASSLDNYWLMEEPALGAEVLERALAHDTSDLPPRVRAKSMWVLAEQCQHIGRDGRAIEICNEAFPLAMAAGDFASAAQCRKVASNAHLSRGELGNAIPLMTEARELAFRSGDAVAIVQVLHDESLREMTAGNLEAARVGFNEALARCEKAGATRHALLVRVNLGNLEEATGDLAEAMALFSYAFDHLRDRRRGLVGPLAGLVSMNLASLLIMQGDVEGALEFMPTVMANSRFHPAGTLLLVALSAGASGDYETASRLHGAADALRQRSGLGASMSEVGERLLQSDRDSLRANRDIDFDRLYASGVQLGEEQALRLATDFVSGLRHRLGPVST